MAKDLKLKILKSIIDNNYYCPKDDTGGCNDKKCPYYTSHSCFLNTLINSTFLSNENYYDSKIKCIQKEYRKLKMEKLKELINEIKGN